MSGADSVSGPINTSLAPTLPSGSFLPQASSSESSLTLTSPSSRAPDSTVAQDMSSQPPMPDMKPQINAARNTLDRIDRLITDPAVPNLGRRLGASIGKVISPVVEGMFGDDGNSGDSRRMGERRRNHNPSGPRSSGASDFDTRKRGGPLRMMEAGFAAVMDIRDSLAQLKRGLLDPIPTTQKPMMGGAGEMRKTPQMVFKPKPSGKPIARPTDTLSLQKPAQPSALNQLLTTLSAIQAGIDAGTQAVADPSVQQALVAIPNIDTNVSSLLTAYNTINPSATAVANNGTAAYNETASNGTEYAQAGGRRRRTKRKQNKKRGTRMRRR